MDQKTEHHGAFDKIEEVFKTKSLIDGGEPASHITLGDLSDGMEERAFGLLLLLLALPCALPFIYGLPQIVAMPMLVLTYQMASGRTSPWLPSALRNRRLPVKSFLNIIAKTKHYAGWLERLAHPRFLPVTSAKGARIVGALLIIPSASILVPLPLTNTVPGIAVGVAAVGLIERDAIFVILGLIAGLIWVLILVIGGPALAYFLIDFILNRQA